MPTLSRVSIAVLLAMVIESFGWDILGLVPGFESLKTIRWARQSVVTLFDLALLLALLRYLGGISFARLWQIVGLRHLDRAAVLWALIIFAPVALVMVLTAPLSKEMTALDLFFKGIALPMTEEIWFRGLAIGALLLVAGWRFWPAALVPSFFFGLGHAAQGQDWMEAVSIAALTGLGGIFFGWLYLKWGHNLWPAFFAHSGMNMLWEVFNLGENAIGGWLGNVERAFVVLAAVFLTLKGRNWLAKVEGQHDRQNHRSFPLAVRRLSRAWFAANGKRTRCCAGKSGSYDPNRHADTGLAG